MQNISNLSGYKRALVLIGLGLCVVAALPPIYIWPLAFVGFSVFFLFLEKVETKRAAFITGWWFGVGFFGGGLYWLSNAFFVHADKHAWLVPIAVPALAATMGVFIGLTAILAYVMWRDKKGLAATFARILLFSVAWVFMEWVRSWVFTGFPWNLIGTIWAFSDEMIQPAAWFGAFGLSFLTIVSITSGAVVLKAQGSKRMVAVMVMITLPVLMWGAGTWRLGQSTNEVHEGILLRLVQPNIAQKNKWKRDLKLENFQDYLTLSEAEGAKGVTHIIWPETAVTYAISRDKNVASAIASVVPKGGYVLTGTPRMTPKGKKPFQVWNSLMVVDEKGSIKGQYDKSHLVPFGEYVPLRDFIPFPKLTAGMVDFTAGAGIQTIDLEGLPAFSPLICYEIIFPNQVINEKNRPQWILNLTNDGWYGDSPGPYQHLVSAKMRSVEEGLPVVRVANTGVTMVTDSYGQIRGYIGYGIRGFIDVELPKPLKNAPLGAQFKTISWGVLLILSFLIGQFMLRRKSGK